MKIQLAVFVVMTPCNLVLYVFTKITLDYPAISYL
jgi:hypothetical protein